MWYNIAMTTATLLKKAAAKDEGVVVLSLREYDRLLSTHVPNYYLTGKAATDLDKLVEGFTFIEEDLLSSEDTSRVSQVINGQMPYVYELLMITYAYEGKYKEAIDAYMPYFKLDPDSKDAQKILSGLRDKLRDPKLRNIPRGVKCMGGRSMIK